MKMPNCGQAFVPEEKITEYLLSETHETGKHKADFFARFGFSLDHIEVFRDALIRHALERDVEKTVSGHYGNKYELRCQLQTPDNRNPCVVSVWIMEKGYEGPRLVTVYPAI